MSDEIVLNIETDIIVAKTRKLKANWTYEAQQDMEMWDQMKKLDEKLLAEVEIAKQASARKKNKYRSIDDPWET